jgi:general nucleoside transport system ATP-binding protein
MTGAAPPRLELVGVSKRYPGVQANQGVDLQVMAGEIHGVLGENGAGKSTLMKIIYGAVHPDEGAVLWDGRPVRVGSPREARALGIAMVFQHFAVFDSLSVAENVWLGIDAKLSRAQIVARIQEVAHAYDLDPDPARLVGRRVSDLSVGERQRVEILRALLAQPRLLILDEPTSVLTPQAAERMFVTLRQLAAGGCSILYISHKLDEVRALCQRCTVLRAGRVTGHVDPRQETNQSLSELMLGSAPPPAARAQARYEEGAGSEPGLEVRGLSLARRERFGTALADIHLSVRAGEILGIAGISGSGQRELLDALSGEDRRAGPGTIWLCGRDISTLPLRGRRAQGLCYVPEERVGRGAVPSLSLAANTLLTRGDAVSRAGALRWGVARRLATRLMERFSVRARTADDAAGTLSGGNLQKFIVGREIDARPRVLLVAQPTWGLDVGATAQIRRELLELAESGAAVLVVSEDLEELFELCGEIVVMARGHVSPRVAVRDASVAQIGQWMSGLFLDGDDGSAPGGVTDARVPDREVDVNA